MKMNKDVLIAVDLVTMARQLKVMNLKNFSIMHEYDYNFVQQISRKLRVAGIITSVRGPGGGVSVVPFGISAYDIHRALGQKATNNKLSDFMAEALMEFVI